MTQVIGFLSLMGDPEAISSFVSRFSLCGHLQGKSADVSFISQPSKEEGEMKQRKNRKMGRKN